MASREQVRQAQQKLRDQGMYSGAVNGEVTPQWQQALRDFQTKHNLQPSGSLNHETMMALGISAGTQGQRDPQSQTSRQQQTPRPQADPSAQHRTEMPGPAASKEQIREAQMALQSKGIDPGPIDGIMGPLTRKAISQFQRQENLHASGELDRPTMMALGIERTAQDQRSQSDTLAMTRQKPSESQTQTQTQPRTQTQPKSPTPSTDQSATTDQQTDSSNQVQTDARMKSQTQDDVDQTTREKSTAADIDSDLKDRINKSAEVLRELSGIQEQAIPQELLQRAEAVAVIPGVVKGALGVGGSYGKGVVSKRLDGGQWSAPAFMQIGGGSWGAQIGITSTDLVLIFTDAKALDSLAGGKSLKLGADASVAAGPIGRSAQAGVDWKLESGVYAYSRAKGLFAGVALDGAVLDMDDDANEDVFGSNVNPQQIMSRPATNPAVQPFVDALKQAAGTKKVTGK